MIRAFATENGRLLPVDAAQAGESVVWMDLHAPSREEAHLAQQWLGVEIPTREEMEEIEISSRLYAEDGAYFMTVSLLSGTDTEAPTVAPVTFVLSGRRLLTVRYSEPKPFRSFPQRAEKAATGCSGGDSILLALLEAVVDRLADILERASRDVETISQNIFQARGTKASERGRDFQKLLTAIGRKEDLVANIRDSLLTLQRLSSFLGAAVGPARIAKDMRARIKTLTRDVVSLADHSTFLSQKINFLLDATLGMINIEQNAIIKIFSVAAVVFLPPTLVASVYGMNFTNMPELGWEWGYPLALALMVASAILPFWYFRRRGWL